MRVVQESGTAPRDHSTTWCSALKAPALLFRVLTAEPKLDRHTCEGGAAGVSWGLQAGLSWGLQAGPSWPGAPTAKELCMLDHLQND